MLFENPPKNIESLIAKSADLTNKPFVHSVVKINGEYEFEDEDIDLTDELRALRDLDVP